MKLKSRKKCIWLAPPTPLSPKNGGTVHALLIAINGNTHKNIILIFFSDEPSGPIQIIFWNCFTFTKPPNKFKLVMNCAHEWLQKWKLY